MNFIAEEVRRYWENTGATVNPGTTPRVIDNFQHKEKVLLPKDMREFFLVVNGMEEGADDHLLFFWPLEDIKNVSTVLGDSREGLDNDKAQTVLQDPESFFVFGDFMIGSHYYAIQFMPNQMENNRVIWIYRLADYRVIANSFSEFLQIYLKYPDEILHPRRS